MAADDFLNQPTDQGLPAETDPASSMSGNRPASGARRATPGEVLSQGFHGAQSAGDFLGLDTEFAGQDPSQGYGASLDTVPPPGTYAEPGAYVPQAPAPLPDGDAMQEFAQAPSAFEFGEDLGSEEGEIAYEDEAQSKKPLLVVALVVAGLVAGGVMYGPQLYSRFRGGETKVAEAPRKPAPARASAETPAPPAPEVRLDPAVTEPIARPEPLVPASSLDDPLLTSSDVTPTSAPFGPFQDQPAAGDAEPVAPADLETAIATGVNPGARPGVIGFPDLTGSEYEWASEDQLELIWRGSEVPLEAVRAPAKTLMPRVGSVRVFTTEDEIFEGRLYAVGQNRVWIDAEPGRIGLDGDRVERIEVLPPAPEGQLVAGADDAPVPGGKRVRVRVPGGMLYGSVLKTEGDDVTLALETGGRVRVKAGDVQELGSGRAVVVRN